MCGGPSQQQQDAANSQTALTNQLASQYKTGEAVTNPFATNLVTNPQQDPALAGQYGQQLAAMKARQAGSGGALPSGFAAAEQDQLGESYAKSQDQNIFGRQMAGAQLLNPMAAASAAQSGNTSIINSPQLSNNFWSNVVQGMISGLGNIPFAFQ